MSTPTSKKNKESHNRIAQFCSQEATRIRQHGDVSRDPVIQGFHTQVSTQNQQQPCSGYLRLEEPKTHCANSTDSVLSTTDPLTKKKVFF